MKKIAIAALVAALLPAAVSAQVVEVTDAGQTLATASDTTTPATGATLTSIGGTLDSQDADLFKIYIATPGAFSATTNNAVTNNGNPLVGALDTALFLFDIDGKAIATNDDANGQAVTSTLAGLSGLAAGYYFLGISISGNEPVNSNSQLVFSGYPGGDTTATRGAASGLTPVTLATFDRNAYDSTPGAYQIDLTGVSAGPAAAAVPEPATWALMLGGFGLIGGALRRRGARALRVA